MLGISILPVGPYDWFYPTPTQTTEVIIPLVIVTVKVPKTNVPEIPPLRAVSAAAAFVLAVVARICALLAVFEALRAEVSELLALVSACVAKSYAILTAFAVAAWVVEVLVTVLLRRTAPSADVEALLIVIVCGQEALI